ncbi:MAG: translocation protein TolB [Candidatus Aerophobetes bacterium ADurb.Bin490]|nr:MAG: translocation protein TolB [Candidatus Aerophobetes bacterium ADurb.Bin490]HNZ28685.1 tetratricopeptide repeat protein [Candidatus Goldiibacteriota bacterium]HPI02991.1 tetratricopeptide repeat protein [Candidatus Goldiibacteriota bacterium]HPN64071.1 tetratricopeptide repeat protein [Candidatus Goldiibacteriota bacterium]HRQ44935.1 tetratricopeptide repeat protein [Candidatus Goldiibacteriota bacterium]
MKFIRAVLFIAAFLPAAFTAYAAESPEAIYNRANAQAASGDNATAIDLLYRVVEDYPSFAYKSDALYRLGTMLYALERYEEAERVFNVLAGKYKNYKYIDKVYEKLIHIYAEVYPNNAKAEAIRDKYKKQFGKTPVLTAIDKTLTIINHDEKLGAALLALDAHFITAGKESRVSSFDREFFPVRNYILDGVYSTDKKYIIKTEGSKKKRQLYIYDAAGKKISAVKGSAGAEAPQWSWDGNYIIFTTLSKSVRKIHIYDVKKKTVKKLFSGKKLEPMLLFSPDGGKIVFIYNGNPWIMEKTGNDVSFLGKVKLKNVIMAAWSHYGDKLIFMENGSKDFKAVGLERKRLLAGEK